MKVGWPSDSRTRRTSDGPAGLPARVCLFAVVAGALWALPAVATPGLPAPARTEEEAPEIVRIGRQTPSAPARPLTESEPWPMGEATGPTASPDIERAKVERAVRDAFAPEAGTRAFLVVHRDRIIAERYGAGFDRASVLPGDAMSDGLVGTLTGVLIRDGHLELWGPPGIEEWSAGGDPRGQVRIADLLRMSSGLAAGETSSAGGAPEASVLDRPLASLPATIGRHARVDTRVLATVLRRSVETRGEELLEWARHALFERIGIRTQMLHVDPRGELAIDHSSGTARDWARLGKLYLQGGVWEGERILPAAFSEFASTPGPAWDQPIHGGSFRINGDGRWSVPRTAYYLAGDGVQRMFIIPTHELVVVRLGDGDEAAALTALDAALARLVDAVPQTRDDTAPGSHLWEPAPE